MMIARRTFLIGLATTIASPAIAQMQQFTGPIATGLMSPRVTFRRVVDLMFSSMPTGADLRSSSFVEEPVRFQFMRDDEALLAITLNPRASYRWASLDPIGLVFKKNNIFRMTCEPCFTHTTLTVISHTKPQVDYQEQVSDKITETFKWVDGKSELQSMEFVDPRYMLVTG